MLMEFSILFYITWCREWFSILLVMLPDHFPKALLQFTFLLTMCESIYFHVFLPVTLSHFWQSDELFSIKERYFSFFTFILSLNFSSSEKSIKSLLHLLDYFSSQVEGICLLKILTLQRSCALQVLSHYRSLSPTPLVLSQKMKCHSSRHRRMHPICCLLGHLASPFTSSPTG